MSRNYRRPNPAEIDQSWLSGRETHIAVACAIHAISDDTRSPDAIWEAPTHTEFDHVAMAVEEYIREGDFQAEDDSEYQWGLEVINLT